MQKYLFYPFLRLILPVVLAFWGFGPGEAAAQTQAQNPPVTILVPGQMPAVPPEMYEMNGIRLKDYQGFEKKWKEVTVRFRTDTGEQRFTYANPKAYEALMKGVRDYPDGAVFAKIGIMTQEDPEFPSSKVPTDAQRIQFMVRDKKKYADTGGWGYALFNPMGFRMDSSMPPEDQARACSACHQIVKESRGEVFSQPMNIWGHPPPPPMHEAALGPELIFTSEQASFQDRAAGKLPKELRELLPPKSASVRFLEGTLREHVFAGTLNEVRPLLMKEARRAGKPALLLSKDGTQYTLIAEYDRDGAGIDCRESQTGFKVYWSASINGQELRTMAEPVCIKLQ